MHQSPIGRSPLVSCRANVGKSSHMGFVSVPAPLAPQNTTTLTRLTIEVLAWRTGLSLKPNQASQHGLVLRK